MTFTSCDNQTSEATRVFFAFVLSKIENKFVKSVMELEYRYISESLIFVMSPDNDEDRQRVVSDVHVESLDDIRVATVTTLCLLSSRWMINIVSRTCMQKDFTEIGRLPRDTVSFTKIIYEFKS